MHNRLELLGFDDMSASSGAIGYVCLSRRSGEVDLSQGRKQMHHRTSDPRPGEKVFTITTPRQAEPIGATRMRSPHTLDIYYTQYSMGGCGRPEHIERCHRL
jgi:hypothetical protein